MLLLSLNPITAIIFIIGAIILGLVILFLGLCFATMFLPIILVLVGLVMLWKGSQGNPVFMVIGGLVMIIGILLWIWS